MSLRVLMVAALLAGCGVSSEDPEALCSDAPIATQGNDVTQMGCAYEQQTYNIGLNGRRLSASGTTLRDASGAAVGTVQYSCAQYLMGKDTNGVAVIVNSATGEVRSHGNFHPGFAVSSLPATLKTPLTY